MDAGLTRNEVRAVYRKFASKYDWWAGLMESRARRRCLERARIHDGETVLEVAVGTGLLFRRVLAANPGGASYGIDLTPEMLARARVRAARAGADGWGLALGDARALPYPDGACDVLLNCYMFDLVPEGDFAAVLGEFRRVLTPGGRLVVVSMTRGARLFDLLWESLYRRRPKLLGGCRGVCLAPHVQAAGFERVEREYISQWGFPSELVFGVKR